MPNVIIFPLLTYDSPTEIVLWKSLVFGMTRSEGATNKHALLFFSYAYMLADSIAAAVFFASGSIKTGPGSMPILVTVRLQ